VVLVTGANSGIGEAIAVAFQEAGAQVFGLGRRKEALEAARARYPDIRWLRADVTNGSEVTAAVESALHGGG
jgi:NADP-dependent 3-hydroxy acid dehydrogenase YdfG